MQIYLELNVNNIFSSDSIKKLQALIEKHDKIVLTCHMRPDGDAIGSTLGLWHLLKKMGKQPSVVIPDRAPRSLQFLPGAGEIAVFSQHDPY